MYVTMISKTQPTTWNEFATRILLMLCVTLAAACGASREVYRGGTGPHDGPPEGRYDDATIVAGLTIMCRQWKVDASGFECNGVRYAYAEIEGAEVSLHPYSGSFIRDAVDGKKLTFTVHFNGQGQRWGKEDVAEALVKDQHVVRRMVDAIAARSGRSHRVQNSDVAGPAAPTIAEPASVTGAANPQEGGCGHDNDCKGDRICEGGRCVAP